MLVREKAKACGIVLYGIVLGLVLALPGCNKESAQAIFRDGDLCRLPGYCAHSTPLGASYGGE